MQEVNSNITTEALNNRLTEVSADLAQRTVVSLAMVPVTIVGVCNTLYTLLILSPALRARNQDIENRIANLEQATGTERPEQVQNYATKLLNSMASCCKKNKTIKIADGLNESKLQDLNFNLKQRQEYLDDRQKYLEEKLGRLEDKQKNPERIQEQTNQRKLTDYFQSSILSSSTNRLGRLTEDNNSLIQNNNIPYSRTAILEPRATMLQR
jgi:ATP-dependent Lon protease